MFFFCETFLSLLVMGCPHITGRTLGVVALHCHKLNKLNIARYEQKNTKKDRNVNEFLHEIFVIKEREKK